MKRDKLLELAAHGRDVGRPRTPNNHKAHQAEQERVGFVIQEAEDAHARYATVERTLRETLADLEAAIIKIEDDEHYHRRVLNQEPACAADYDYIRSVLAPLIIAVKTAKSANEHLGKPTKARLEAAEKRRMP